MPHCDALDTLGDALDAQAAALRATAANPRDPALTGRCAAASDELQRANRASAGVRQRRGHAVSNDDRSAAPVPEPVG